VAKRPRGAPGIYELEPGVFKVVVSLGATATAATASGPEPCGARCATRRPFGPGSSPKPPTGICWPGAG